MRRQNEARHGRRRLLGLAALAAAVTVLASACGSQAPVYITKTITPSANAQITVSSLPETSPTTDTSQSDDSASQTTTEPTTTAPKVDIRITASPEFGSKKLSPTTPVRVTSFNATLAKVEMVGDDGASISGEISEDDHTWTSKERLKYGVSYTVSGLAKGIDGSDKPFEGKLTTVKPKKTMAAYIQIPDGKTVGIASPIVVTFAGSVTNRAAAEKNLHVTTKDADGKKIEVEGSWGWMPDEDIQGNGVMQSRVHFRPKEYWPAHTRVHVAANLYGVDYGGAWGREDLTRDFKIGDNIVVKADVTSHRLVVVKDDKVIRNYPVSYGVPKTVDQGRTTVEGIHIVQGFEGDPKTGKFTMSNPKYGYHDVVEYWGVRINNNGEFIHVNKQTEAAGYLGKQNVSHGCVNMGMKDGKEFYDMMYYGIPVEVENTGVPMTERDYVWDWAYSYAQWKTLSAL